MTALQRPEDPLDDRLEEMLRAYGGPPHPVGAARRAGGGRLTIFVAAAVIALAVAAAAAVFDRGGGESARQRQTSAGSCEHTARYGGRTYIGVNAKVEPLQGASLGRTTLPCVQERVELMEIRGVPPSVAITTRDGGVVLVRENVDLRRLPPDVDRLLETPKCDPRDEPIELAGPWRGISGADGHTELDPLPPYDLLMHAVESSAASYERAHLTIRVPQELGRPITRADIRSSLWKQGTVRVTARCAGGRFVATRVEAVPGSRR